MAEYLTKDEVKERINEWIDRYLAIIDPQHQKVCEVCGILITVKDAEKDTSFCYCDYESDAY